MTMEHQIGGGGLYFKSNKDACMSSNLKTLHTFFYSLQENAKKSPARLRTKKESLS
jgi:ribosomal protein L33